MTKSIVRCFTGDTRVTSQVSVNIHVKHVNFIFLSITSRLMDLKTKPESHFRPMTLVPPRPGSEYNIQCQHLSQIGFIPSEEHRIMPKETSLYTTIIRSPVSQFVSAFRFFGVEDDMRQVFLIKRS